MMFCLSLRDTADVYASDSYPAAMYQMSPKGNDEPACLITLHEYLLSSSPVCLHGGKPMTRVISGAAKLTAAEKVPVKSSLDSPY